MSSQANAFTLQAPEPVKALDAGAAIKTTSPSLTVDDIRGPQHPIDSTPNPQTAKEVERRKGVTTKESLIRLTPDSILPPLETLSNEQSSTTRREIARRSSFHIEVNGPLMSSTTVIASEADPQSLTVSRLWIFALLIVVAALLQLTPAINTGAEWFDLIPAATSLSMVAAAISYGLKRYFDQVFSKSPDS